MGSNSEKARMTLRILATTDVHMHLTGLNETTGAPTTGLARLAPLIRAERAAVPTGLSLVLDNGDLLQGTTLARVAFKGPHDASHPLAQVLSAIGYDAIGLGNHDFDFGTSYLDAVCRILPCPVTSANVEGLHHVRPHLLLTREAVCSDGQSRRIRIGIASALPEETGKWNRHKVAPGVTITEPLAALETAVEQLCGAGADVIILLAHAGFRSAENDAENFADVALTLENVDAVVAGHTHLVYSSTGGSTPCVLPGFAANCLGRIDLDLTHAPEEGWQVVSGEAAILYPDEADLDPGVLQALSSSRTALAARNADTIGSTPQHLHSFFALLQPNPLYGLVSGAMLAGLDRLNLADDIADLPRLAAVSPLMCGGRGGPEHFANAPPGPVTRDILDKICPFEDFLTAHVLTGRELRDHLERAAAIYAAPPAPHQLLLHSEMPCYYADFIKGISVEIDPRCPPRFSPSGALIDPAASRVRKFQRAGSDIADDDRFLVAMTSYRAVGGGGYPDRKMANENRNAPIIRDLIAAQLAASEIGSPPDWSLLRGKTEDVLYDTNPNAQNHLDEIAQFEPKVLGVTPMGYLRLSLKV